VSEVDRRREDEWFRQNEEKLLDSARLAREKRERERAALEEEAERKRLKEQHFMRCPKCGHGLKETLLEGIAVDQCSFCEACSSTPASSGSSSSSANPSRRASCEGCSASEPLSRMPYLVDGNNLLGSWEGAARRGWASGGDAARRGVLPAPARPRHDRLRRRAAAPDRSAQQIGPVAIRVPAEGQDADSVIRSIIDRAERPREWIVVTSDKPLYSYVRTRGASVLRAHEWNALASQAGRSVTQGDKPERETDVEGWLDVFSAAGGAQDGDDDH